MGLYTTLSVALADAFDTELADAVSVLTLVQKEYIYDTDTGDNVVGTTKTATRGVVAIVSNNMVDGEVIRATDTVFTILQSELSKVPKLGDFITHGAVEYSINAIIPDPASAIYELVGRNV